MKKLLICLAICMSLLGTTRPAVSLAQGRAVQMDILFMNHGPMQPTIRALKDLIQRYPGGIEARWYDYDRESGKTFMNKNNIQGHIPLLIVVNGSATHMVQGRRITFSGFPSGAGPYQFQGKWSLNDLENLLQTLKSTDG